MNVHAGQFAHEIDEFRFAKELNQLFEIVIGTWINFFSFRQSVMMMDILETGVSALAGRQDNFLIPLVRNGFQFYDLLFIVEYQAPRRFMFQRIK